MQVQKEREKRDVEWEVATWKDGRLVKTENVTVTEESAEPGGDEDWDENEQARKLPSCKSA